MSKVHSKTQKSLPSHNRTWIKRKTSSQVRCIHFSSAKTYVCEIYKHIIIENIPLYSPPHPRLFPVSLLSTPRPIIKHVLRAALSWRGSLLRWTSKTGGPHGTHIGAQSTLYLELLTRSRSRSPLAVFFVHPFMFFDLSLIPLHSAVFWVCQ